MTEPSGSETTARAGKARGRSARENDSTPTTSAPSDGPRRIPDDLFRTRWEPLAAALGDRYADCSLDSFQVTDDRKYAGRQKAVLDQLRSYLDKLPQNVREGRGIVLFGPPGTGKDHLLVGMLREAVWRGCRVRWKDGMRLYRNVREAIHSDSGEGSISRPLIETDVLGISDPVPPKGASVTDFQAAFLFDLIDSRYRARRPTWVTANFADSAEADSRLGAQIVDRLRDGALACHCNWGSYRKAVP